MVDMARRYDYKGHARYRLSSQVEQVEDLWDQERRQRSAFGHALSDEKRTQGELQWQLREAEQLVSAEQTGHHDLLLQFEKAKHETEKAMAAAKQVRREKKELQMRITQLSDEIRRYEADAVKKHGETAESEKQVEKLRREHIVDADKASDFQGREIAFALDRLKDSDKRVKELQHTFDLERQHYEAKQKGTAIIFPYTYLI